MTRWCAIAPRLMQQRLHYGCCCCCRCDDESGEQDARAAARVRRREQCGQAVRPSQHRGDRATAAMGVGDALPRRHLRHHYHRMELKAASFYVDALHLWRTKWRGQTRTATTAARAVAAAATMATRSTKRETCRHRFPHQSRLFLIFCRHRQHHFCGRHHAVVKRTSPVLLSTSCAHLIRLHLKKGGKKKDPRCFALPSSTRLNINTQTDTQNKKKPTR